MTVCTNDLALCNLVEHILPAATLQALRNRELLVPQVVELEDDRVLLPAIDARMFPQKATRYCVRSSSIAILRCRAEAM